MITDAPRIRRLPRYESLDAYRDSRPGKAFWLQGWVESFGIWNSDGIAYEIFFVKKLEELILHRCDDEEVVVLARGVTSEEVGEATTAATDAAGLTSPDNVNNLDWLDGSDLLGRGLAPEAVQRRRGMPRSRFRRPDQLIFG